MVNLTYNMTNGWQAINPDCFEKLQRARTQDVDLA